MLLKLCQLLDSTWVNVWGEIFQGKYARKCANWRLLNFDILEVLRNVSMVLAPKRLLKANLERAIHWACYALLMLMIAAYHLLVMMIEVRAAILMAAMVFFTLRLLLSIRALVPASTGFSTMWSELVIKSTSHFVLTWFPWCAYIAIWIIGNRSINGRPSLIDFEVWRLERRWMGLFL